MKIGKSSINKSDKPIRYVGCCCCGLRWVELEEAPPSLGCYACGSSAVDLERNLVGEAARIIKKYGQGFRSGK